MALYPVLLLRDAVLKEDIVLLNHEKIHLRQQLELFILLFYIWYTVEFLIKLIIYRNRKKAYYNICFERETYTHEADLNYLANRKSYNFISFIKI